VKTLGSPIKMSATPPDVSGRAPLFGEHTDAVLREAGYSDAEISLLRSVNAVA
jgi:formyl-CoA transferase